MSIVRRPHQKRNGGQVRAWRGAPATSANSDAKLRIRERACYGAGSSHSAGTSRSEHWQLHGVVVTAFCQLTGTSNSSSSFSFSFSFSMRASSSRIPEAADAVHALGVMSSERVGACLVCPSRACANAPLLAASSAPHMPNRTSVRVPSEVRMESRGLLYARTESVDKLTRGSTRWATLTTVRAMDRRHCGSRSNPSPIESSACGNLLRRVLCAAA
ncbi:MAG: hypothetical protein RL701_665 [Pseudomonadota bacterium]